MHLYPPAGIHGILPRFGSVVVFDLGASNKKQGHLRLKILDDQGVTRDDSFDGSATPQGFNRSDDLVRGIARRIAQNLRQLKDVLGGDDTLKGVVGFLPGTPRDGVLPDIMFLEDSKGKSLLNIDFNRLHGHLARHRATIDPNFRMLLFNDAFGGAAQAAHFLVNSPQYAKRVKKGLNAFYMASGGGFGVKDIRCFDNRHLLISTASGAVERPEFSQVLGVSSFRELVEQYFEELMPTSVHYVIRFFGEALGLDKSDIQKLVYEGNARIVTQYPSDFSRQFGISEHAYRNAADFAIDRYTDSVSLFCFTKILNGTNLGILTGPLVGGIKGYLSKYADTGRFQQELATFDKKYPRFAQKHPLEKLVLNRTFGRLEAARVDSNLYRDFDLTTALDVKNNLAGAPYLLQADVDTVRLKTGAYRIPVGCLKQPPGDLPKSIRRFKQQVVKE